MATKADEESDRDKDSQSPGAGGNDDSMQRVQTQAAADTLRQGKLQLDATYTLTDIVYPTQLCREKLEQIIDVLHAP